MIFEVGLKAMKVNRIVKTFDITMPADRSFSEKKIKNAMLHAISNMQIPRQT
jgi:hypothetical protein